MWKAGKKYMETENDLKNRNLHNTCCKRKTFIFTKYAREKDKY